MLLRIDSTLWMLGLVLGIVRPVAGATDSTFCTGVEPPAASATFQQLERSCSLCGGRIEAQSEQGHLCRRGKGDLLELGGFACAPNSCTVSWTPGPGGPECNVWVASNAAAGKRLPDRLDLGTLAIRGQAFCGMVLSPSFRPQVSVCVEPAQMHVTCIAGWERGSSSSSGAYDVLRIAGQKVVADWWDEQLWGTVPIAGASPLLLRIARDRDSIFFRVHIEHRQPSNKDSAPLGGEHVLLEFLDLANLPTTALVPRPNGVIDFRGWNAFEPPWVERRVPPAYVLEEPACRKYLNHVRTSQQAETHIAFTASSRVPPVSASSVVALPLGSCSVSGPHPRFPRKLTANGLAGQWRLASGGYEAVWRLPLSPVLEKIGQEFPSTRVELSLFESIDDENAPPKLVAQSSVEAYFWDPHPPSWQQVLRRLDSANEAGD